MKKIVFLFLMMGIFVVSCNSKDNGLKVTLKNTEAFDRQSELVEIPVEGIKAKVVLKDGQAYIVSDDKGAVVPSQLTADGKLLFQSNLKANDSLVYTITAGEAQKFETKTFARFITERKDDFAWENDRVAFRVYGPALIASDGPSNGLDIWYKRTNAMIIDKWYKNDLAGVASYHTDSGEGLDDYKVGRTLGAGAMAPYVNGKLWLNENFSTQELIDNGPLRTTFKLTHKNIDVDGKSYTEARVFSIDAGSQLTKITQEYGGVESPMAVAAGIVKREKNDSIITSIENNYVIYAEPSSTKAGDVYLTLVFPQGLEKSLVDTYGIVNEKTKKESKYSHVLGITTYKPNTPLVYYTGYGWSRFGFEKVGDFQKYVETFSNALKHPILVTY